MMLKKTLLNLKKHFVLIAVLSAVLAVLALFKLPFFQPIIFTILVLFYLTWALLHHFIDKSLTLEVALEYILTAALAEIIILSLVL